MNNCIPQLNHLRKGQIADLIYETSTQKSRGFKQPQSGLHQSQCTAPGILSQFSFLSQQHGSILFENFQLGVLHLPPPSTLLFCSCKKLVFRWLYFSIIENFRLFLIILTRSFIQIYSVLDLVFDCYSWERFVWKSLRKM